MSRLRKEVLASRVGNGEDAATLAAPTKQRGPRGLAMKEGRRMKVPMGVRSETRSLRLRKGATAATRCLHPNIPNQLFPTHSSGQVANNDTL